MESKDNSIVIVEVDNEVKMDKIEIDPTILLSRLKKSIDAIDNWIKWNDQDFIVDSLEKIQKETQQFVKKLQLKVGNNFQSKAYKELARLEHCFYRLLYDRVSGLPPHNQPTLIGDSLWKAYCTYCHNPEEPPFRPKKPNWPLEFEFGISSDEKVDEHPVVEYLAYHYRYPRFVKNFNALLKDVRELNLPPLRVFISYAWPLELEDKNKKKALFNKKACFIQPFLKQLTQDLQQAGLVVYLDLSNSPAGGNINQFMELGLKHSDVILVICTESIGIKSRNNKYNVHKELQLIQLLHKRGRRIYPLLLSPKCYKTAVPQWMQDKQTKLNVMETFVRGGYLNGLWELITNLYNIPFEAKNRLQARFEHAINVYRKNLITFKDKENAYKLGVYIAALKLPASIPTCFTDNSIKQYFLDIYSLVLECATPLKIKLPKKNECDKYDLLCFMALIHNQIETALLSGVKEFFHIGRIIRLAELTCQTGVEFDFNNLNSLKKTLQLVGVANNLIQKIVTMINKNINNPNAFFDKSAWNILELTLKNRMFGRNKLKDNFYRIPEDEKTTNNAKSMTADDTLEVFSPHSKNASVSTQELQNPKISHDIHYSEFHDLKEKCEENKEKKLLPQLDTLINKEGYEFKLEREGPKLRIQLTNLNDLGLHSQVLRKQFRELRTGLIENITLKLNIKHDKHADFFVTPKFQQKALIVETKGPQAQLQMNHIVKMLCQKTLLEKENQVVPEKISAPKDANVQAEMLCTIL